MSGEHTPGPWLRDGNTIYALEHYGWNKGKELLRNRFSASVQGCYSSSLDEQEANARLIAAAPDLLEALQKLLKHPTGYSEPFMREEREQARAAISKALGQEVGVAA